MSITGSIRFPVPDGFTRERLETEYWHGQKTIVEIADLFGTSRGLIASWMKRWSIPRRPIGPAPLIPTVSKEVLETEYINNYKTVSEVGQVFGVSSVTVARWMKYYGIPRRQSGSKRIRLNFLTPAVLYEKYWTDGKSLEQVADELGVNWSIVFNRMKEYGIPRRPLSELNKVQWTEEKRQERSRQVRELWNTPAYRERMTGSNSPVWNGGTSKKPYPFEFDMNLKTRIRERDEYTCAVCRMPAVAVHHIDYDKDNLDEDNLIVLCTSCHTSTNHRRELWRETLMELRQVEKSLPVSSALVWS